MKTLIAAGLILLTTMGARANIVQIDYTHDNITLLGNPQSLIGAFAAENDFAHAYLLGERPERNLVHTDFFANKPTNTATISWDFPEVATPVPDQPIYYTFIHVKAVFFASDNQINLYAVTGPDQFKGQITSTLDRPIDSIFVLGTFFAPDSGATLPLLGLTLVGLAVFKFTAKHK